MLLKVISYILFIFWKIVKIHVSKHLIILNIWSHLHWFPILEIKFIWILVHLCEHLISWFFIFLVIVFCLNFFFSNTILLIRLVFELTSHPKIFQCLSWSCINFVWLTSIWYKSLKLSLKQRKEWITIVALQTNIDKASRSCLVFEAENNFLGTSVTTSNIICQKIYHHFRVYLFFTD
jgi:hypothetical protein